MAATVPSGSAHPRSSKMSTQAATPRYAPSRTLAAVAGDASGGKATAAATTTARSRTRMEVTDMPDDAIGSGPECPLASVHPELAPGLGARGERVVQTGPQHAVTLVGADHRPNLPAAEVLGQAPDVVDREGGVSGRPADQPDVPTGVAAGHCRPPASNREVVHRQEHVVVVGERPGGGRTPREKPRRRDRAEPGAAPHRLAKPAGKGHQPAVPDGHADL